MCEIVAPLDQLQGDRLRLTKPLPASFTAGVVTVTRWAAVVTFDATNWYQPVDVPLVSPAKRAEYEKDVAQLNPLHVIVAGLVAAALFVLGLIVLVRWVVGSGVAAG